MAWFCYIDGAHCSDSVSSAIHHASEISLAHLVHVWGRILPDKRPMLEHKFHRNNKVRKEPLFNWDMERIVLNQLRSARRWQFIDAGKFQDEMLAKRDKHKEKEEKLADEKFSSFLTDDYWIEKGRRELEGDYSKVQTKWSGSEITNPGGK